MYIFAQNDPGFAVHDDKNGWKVAEVSEMPFESKIYLDFQETGYHDLYVQPI